MERAGGGPGSSLARKRTTTRLRGAQRSHAILCGRGAAAVLLEPELPGAVLPHAATGGAAWVANRQKAPEKRSGFGCPECLPDLISLGRSYLRSPGWQGEDESTVGQAGSPFGSPPCRQPLCPRGNRAGRGAAARDGAGRARWVRFGNPTPAFHLDKGSPEVWKDPCSIWCPHSLFSLSPGRVQDASAPPARPRFCADALQLRPAGPNPNSQSQDSTSAPPPPPHFALHPQISEPSTFAQYTFFPHVPSRSRFPFAPGVRGGSGNEGLGCESWQKPTAPR